MKVAIDTDLNVQKIDWALNCLRNDLLPGEEDLPESMQGGHGEVLTIAIDVLDKMRQAIADRR